MMCFALFGSAGPDVTGALFNTQGAYRQGFLLLAVLYLLDGLFAVALGRLRTGAARP